MHAQENCKQGLERFAHPRGLQQGHSGQWGKQPKSPPGAMEYHSALKRKDILAPATTWMDLEDMMLSDMSQSPGDQFCDILLP